MRLAPLVWSKFAQDWKLHGLDGRELFSRLLQLLIQRCDGLRERPKIGSKLCPLFFGTLARFNRQGGFDFRREFPDWQGLGSDSQTEASRHLARAERLLQRK